MSRMVIVTLLWSAAVLAAPSATEARCRSCHTAENSPRWDFARYRAAVAAVCRAGHAGR